MPFSLTSIWYKLLFHSSISMDPSESKQKYSYHSFKPQILFGFSGISSSHSSTFFVWMKASRGRCVSSSFHLLILRIQGLLECAFVIITTSPAFALGRSLISLYVFIKIKLKIISKKTKCEQSHQLSRNSQLLYISVSSIIRLCSYQEVSVIFHIQSA